MQEIKFTETIDFFTICSIKFPQKFLFLKYVKGTCKARHKKSSIFCVL